MAEAEDGDEDEREGEGESDESFLGGRTVTDGMPL